MMLLPKHVSSMQVTLKLVRELGIFAAGIKFFAFFHKGRRGDNRFRHGHRQARRALRCALLALEIARELLPGERASWKR